MGLKYLLEKEFKQLLRNKFMVGVAVMFPLAVLLIMPWATNLDIKNIQVALVDNDHSPLSHDFIRQVEHSTYFNLQSQTGMYREALADLERWDADLILEIPAGFERDLVQFGTTPVQITINTVNSMKGVMGQSYMNELLMQYARALAETGNRPQYIASPKVELITQYMYNPTLNYRFTMIPGLIMITLIILGGFLPAVNIVVEKEMGTIEQLNVTPIGKFAFILAKLIPFWIIGLVAVSFGFLFAWLIYGLVPLGHFLTLYFFAALFILTMTGFGLLISNHSATIQQALFVMFFFVIIFIMLSGLLTPIDSMPGWAKWIAAFTPTKYVVNVLQSVYLRGSTIADLWIDMLVLIAMMLFFNIWAVISYRKSQ